MRGDSEQSYRDEVKSALVNQFVVTKYNRRVYRVDDVVFDKNPDSTFRLVKGDEEFFVSFADYLRNKHKFEVKDHEQPLLVIYDTFREQIIHLVPECCHPVSQEDDLDDKKAFKEFKEAQNADAPIRVKELTQFLKQLMQRDEVVERMRAWRFYFDKSPIEIEGVKFDAGKVIMGRQSQP